MTNPMYKQIQWQVRDQGSWQAFRQIRRQVYGQVRQQVRGQVDRQASDLRQQINRTARMEL